MTEKARRKVEWSYLVGGLVEKYNIRKAKILDTGELLLPSGRVAGHRDYLMYYKQRITVRDNSESLKMLKEDAAAMRKARGMDQALVLRAATMASENQLSVRTYQAFLANLRKRSDKATIAHQKRIKTNWVKYEYFIQIGSEREEASEVFP